MRILIVEDEPDLQEVIRKRLTRENYSVDACGDGEEAMDYILITAYDVIVLDIMLPAMSGVEILKKMRAKSDKTPVLMLTAKDSIEDRVKGLDYGADDYLVKPFAFDELLARIRVLLRRNNNEVINEMQVGDLTLNPETRQVVRNGDKIELSAKEFGILEYMIRNQGIVLSRDQIEQHAWNYDFEGGSNVVDVYIRYLRRKIDHDYDQKLIHTVRGVGYVLRME